MFNGDKVEVVGDFRWFDHLVEYAAVSDKGKVRRGNEDSFLIIDSEAFFCVADGAGGHENGAKASQLTVQGMEKYLTKSIDINDATVPLYKMDGMHLTTEAITYVNQVVFRESQGKMMASTIVACQLYQQKLLLEYVGDSRCYLLRKKQLKQLTEDHSVVNDLFRNGKITREEMKNHKYRNVITRAIGSEENVAIDSDWIEYQTDDTFLLCSDGLSSYISENEISASIEKYDTPLKVAEDLILSANNAGGGDNITVIVITFSE